MPQRFRLTLLVLVLLALTGARTGGAWATPSFTDRDDAQLVASRQIQFIAYARLLLGVPYSYGGTSSDNPSLEAIFSRATSSSSTAWATSASISAAGCSSTRRTPARASPSRAFPAGTRTITTALGASSSSTRTMTCRRTRSPANRHG